MSIFLNIGQCGNQVGAILMELAKETKENKHRETMRCILVDTEPKVVRSIKANASVASIHVEQSGRGNNWAMGYNQTKNRDLCERVMEALRKEMEGIDCYRGSVLLHSLAGGTGSGLGCRLLELIRDLYPKAYIANGCIAPSLCGDTPLQNYNAIFTMAHLQEYSDVVLYKDNDDLIRSVAYWKTQVSKEQSPAASLSEMNALVAADWSGLLLPTVKDQIRRVFDLGDFVTRMSPMAQAKFVDVRSAYYSSKLKPSSFVQVCTESHQDSSVLLRHLLASFPRSTSKALCTSAVIRGFKNDFPMSNALKQIKKAIPCVSWSNPQPSAQFSSAPPCKGSLSSLTVCSNGTNILPTLSVFMDRFTKQFQANAYVHWYKKFGVEEDYFNQSYEKAKSIADEYAAMMEA